MTEVAEKTEKTAAKKTRTPGKWLVFQELQFEDAKAWVLIVKSPVEASSSRVAIRKATADLDLNGQPIRLAAVKAQNFRPLTVAVESRDPVVTFSK